MGSTVTASTLPARDQVPLEQTWNLADIYATPDDWERDLQHVDGDVAAVTVFQGRLAAGPDVVLACLQARDSLMERLQRVLLYAHLASSVDGLAPQNQAMAARADALAATAEAAQTFVPAELLALPDGTIERYLGAAPGLELFRPQLDNVLRRRPHVLAPETEQALAALSETLNLPSTIHQRTTAVDLVCVPVRDESGQDVPVSIARYVFGLAQAPDRALRRSAYESLAAGIGAHRATLCAALATHITRNVTLARLRRYSSATAMILDTQQVPPAVYHNVLNVVHDELAPHMRRLLRLRQRMLGVDQLYRYDLEAPLDPTYDPATTFDESARLIQEGLRPLGEEYGRIIAAAFQDRWIDRADNLGKGSGAFCLPVYGVHPYVFTTWQDNLRSALTIGHELGHAGHMSLSARSQIASNALMLADIAYSPMFFIEAPSTTNELLVGRHILDTADDPRLRRWTILQLLSTFTHNMVTHLLEAHFEQRLYELAEEGQPLTPATIMDVQGAVFERFFAGTVAIDEGARLYWAQQPHFYSNLYPYTYAAGLSCAFSVVEAIRSEGQPAVDRWLGALSAGCTVSSIALMQRVGVDMSGPEPIRRAVQFFGSLVDELEQSFT